MSVAPPAAGIGILVVAIAAAQTPAPPASPRPLVPVAASTLIADASPFFGQVVTIYAPVEQRLSAAAFSLDQDATKRSERDLLVLTRTLYGAVEPNTYVTVVGEVVPFDPPKIPADYLLNVPDDVLTKYRGRAAVLATSVITASVVDLAKRPPAPMTAEEEAYDKIMKRVGPSFNALRQAVTASNAEAISKEIATLKPAFAETQAFWKKRNTADALQWSQEAMKHTAAIETAAAAARWDDVKSAAASLGQACQDCHGKYRERLDDGSSRIRGTAVK